MRKSPSPIRVIQRAVMAGPSCCIILHPPTNGRDFIQTAALQARALGDCNLHNVGRCPVMYFAVLLEAWAEVLAWWAGVVVG